MTESPASQAFQMLFHSLPSGEYEVRTDYKESQKIELRRTAGRPWVVLVWMSNGKKNELTTRIEYVQALRVWIKGFTPESAKPDYYSTTEINSEQFLELVRENSASVANAIVSINSAREGRGSAA